MALIEKFWVVTMPARRSTIGDICCETDWLGLENQFRGGLKAEDIRGVCNNEEAKEHAEKLIQWRQDEAPPPKRLP